VKSLLIAFGCAALALAFAASQAEAAKGKSREQARKECQAQHPKGSAKGGQLYNVRKNCIQQKMRGG
jgi:hypothetical protein